MNLKKRLTITFITLTFLPITLTVITFAFLCGMVSFNEDARELFKDFSLESASEITEVAEETYYEIEAQLGIDPDRFANENYLNELNLQLSEESSYIIVRKDSEIYFNGNGDTSDPLLKKLPAYHIENEEMEIQKENTKVEEHIITNSDVEQELSEYYTDDTTFSDIER